MALEVVDPSISLAHTLDEFEETLQDVSSVDVEEGQDAMLAYQNTSKNSLESFLRSLSRQVGFKHEGVLRLAGLFHLIRPWNSQPKASKLNGVPSVLFGVLKAGVDGMAYVYFTYDDRDRQTPFAMYAGIISQLLRDSNQLKEEMFRLFEEQTNLARKQTWQILKSFKRAMTSLKASKLLVFDALDEASEETREEVLDLLDSARSSSPRIFVTSRSDYRESISHEQVQRYRVHAIADDIRTFSEERLKSRNVQRIVKAKYGTGVEARRFASNISEEILTNSRGL